jgi:aminobenzoyl-glutamate utilization protein A
MESFTSRSTSRQTLEFSHAGVAPESGKNTIQVLGTAIQNSYAILCHGEGATRVNIGRVEGGTASNVISDSVRIEAEARGETTELMEYTFKRLKQVLRESATMHDCDVDFEVTGHSPRADSNEDLSAVVYEASKRIDGVTDSIMQADFGGSEDATCLMNVFEDKRNRSTSVSVRYISVLGSRGSRLLGISDQRNVRNERIASSRIG